MCEKETDHSACSQAEEGLVPRSSCFDIAFPKAVLDRTLRMVNNLEILFVRKACKIGFLI